MRRGCRMAKIIQQSERPNIIEEELNRLFSAEWLRETAKETGFVKRDRKIDPALMFWSLTLGRDINADGVEACLLSGFFGKS